MFFFKKNKNQNTPATSVTKTPEVSSAPKIDWSEKNAVTFLEMLIDTKSQVKIMFLDTTALKSPKSMALMPKILDEVLIDFTRTVKGRLFDLLNKSVLLVFKPGFEDELQTLLIKLQFMLNDEMLQSHISMITDSKFITFYDSYEQWEELKNKIANITPFEERNDTIKKTPTSGVFANVMNSNKKAKRVLSPQILDKLQKVLSQVDFSSLVRRQAICAVIGKSAPQMIFEEVFVSIPDLRDVLLPDVDFTANPWLFTHLTETLDKRVLAHVNKHDDGALVSNFSINLNVSTILSDEFLEFDDSIPAPLRSSIVLELQLVDIFNDVKAFLLAKAFAQYRGYKICIDGINVDKLQYINRENLKCDLMKIIWHPSFMDVINTDKHFTDYVNKAERAKMILCRVDDAKAIEIGNSLGINLYQGRYVQSQLNKKRK